MAGVTRLFLALAVSVPIGCSEPPPPKQPRPKPRPAEATANRHDGRPPLTSKVAGYSFGMTEQQASRECEIAGGKPISVLRPRPQLICTVAKVPLDFPVDGVAFFFCDGLACEPFLRR